MKRNGTMWNSFLGDDLKRYVRYKRALGYRYDTEEGVLRLLDRYLCRQPVRPLSAIDSRLVESFLASRQRSNARSYNHLRCAISGFFNWMVIQNRMEDTPVKVAPRRSGPRPTPFLFDHEMAARLIEDAKSLPDHSSALQRGPTYHLIFVMMYTLGLRVGEVSRLMIKEVDLDHRVLKIEQTKFFKDRLVPFGPRLAAGLIRHLNDRKDRVGESTEEAPLFTFRGGRAIHPCTISQTFHHLVQHKPMFTPPPGVASPRVHCLRHSFAVNTLLRWYREGIDISGRLIHLSTFLGHVDPSSTAWYLTITTELLDEANKRFERYAAPVIGGNTP